MFFMGVLRRGVFQFAHTDAGMAYDFNVAAPIGLYDVGISLVGEEQTDAPARRVSGMVFYDVHYYHVPGVRREPLWHGQAMPCDVLSASWLF
jgi:hypothetical protein